MEIYTLNEDLRIICSEARSFPEGIKDAFTALEKGLPDIGSRTFFGMSKPNAKGVIIYKAGTSEQSEGEAARYGFDLFVLEKGKYLTETLHNWREKEENIGASFMKLLKDPRLDPKSFCIEWYKEEDVLCMVKIIG